MTGAPTDALGMQAEAGVLFTFQIHTLEVEPCQSMRFVVVACSNLRSLHGRTRHHSQVNELACRGRRSQRSREVKASWHRPLRSHSHMMVAGPHCPEHSIQSRCSCRRTHLRPSPSVSLSPNALSRRQSTSAFDAAALAFKFARCQALASAFSFAFTCSMVRAEGRPTSASCRGRCWPTCMTECNQCNQSRSVGSRGLNTSRIGCR